MATVDLGASTWGVVATDDVVWVTNRDEGTVTGIDPTTNEVADSLEAGAGPTGVTMTADAVWVVHPNDDAVSRIPI